LRLDDRSLPEYVNATGLLPGGAPLRIEAAGDGNINYVRRVRAADGRSLVVKHARDCLEKFPQYRVKPERLLFERRFAEVVARLAPEESRLLPRVLHFDAERFVIVMEDLGDAPALVDELVAGRVNRAALRRLGRFLGALQRATRPEAGALVACFSNAEMRELHGEHIFTLPFEPNDFPISAELRDHAARMLSHRGARDRIRELRSRYYASDAGLVHGDVQAGNVLLQGDVPRLLDAEIAHVGDPAFDLGTALAHVHFHVALSDDPAPFLSGIDALVQGFRETGGQAEDAAWGERYAGVEMLRRTIGAARLRFLEPEDAARRALEHGLRLLLS
jgi:5-methylthioribose kinase